VWCERGTVSGAMSEGVGDGVVLSGVWVEENPPERRTELK